MEVDGRLGKSQGQDFLRRVWYVGRGSGSLGGGGSNKGVVDLSRAGTGHFCVIASVLLVYSGVCLSIFN